jgi:hypothetical protein
VRAAQWTSTDEVQKAAPKAKVRDQTKPDMPDSRHQVAGTFAAVRAFVLRTVEANMPLSFGSYMLGIGTVVGALAFGFGGGVLLTNTAMKESPAGQTRVERLARTEPESPAVSPAPSAQTTLSSNQAAFPNQVTAIDQGHPASVAAIKQDAAQAQQPAAVRPDPVPASQAEPPKPDAARKPDPDAPRQIEAAGEPQPAKQAAREPQPQKQVEQTERTEAKPVESKETDLRTERSRRYAERRLRDNVAPRMRQRRLDVQEEPAQEVVVARPPEQHFDLFGGFFGRPADVND